MGNQRDNRFYREAQPAPAPLPTCFGKPIAAMDESAEYCEDCPHFEGCKSARAKSAAPLPEEMAWELRELSAYVAQNPGMPLAHIYDRITSHITSQARRLAEVEAERDEAHECLTIAHMDGYHKGQKAGQSEHNNGVRMGQHILESESQKRLRESAEADVQRLSAEKNHWIKESMKHESQRDANIQGREAAEARVRELETWARTWGCYSCAHAGKCPVSDQGVQAVLNGGLCGSWEIKDMQAALAATGAK